MSDGDVLISCDDVSKRFCSRLRQSLWYGTKDIVADLFGAKHSSSARSETLRAGEFWANKNINFEVRRGECLALIGRNGAGKTTLLKMLNGLIKPDAGKIQMRGKVSALISLGAGFNPILSGRENIYINGSILGLSKRRIHDRIDQIIEFAEIEQFIDTPVRNYSSGMQVRLGFATAVNLIEPDILLLDEVLAVGDIGFVIKCLNAVNKLLERTAVIFVSHNMPFVSRFCDRVLVLKHGQVIADEHDVSKGILYYLDQFRVGENIAGSGDATISNGELRLSSFNHPLGEEEVVPHGACLEFDFELNCIQACRVEVQVDAQDLSPVLSVSVINGSGSIAVIEPGQHRCRIKLGQIEFTTGRYSLAIIVSDVRSNKIFCRHQDIVSFQTQSGEATWGRISRHALLQNVSGDRDSRPPLNP